MTKIFKINHLKSRFNNIIYLIFLIIIVSHLKQIISVKNKTHFNQCHGSRERYIGTILIIIQTLHKNLLI